MRKLISLGAVLVAAATVTSVAAAADPVPSTFPAAKVKQVFIAAQTLLPDGTVNGWFTPGSTVVFRAYAVDGKTKKVVAAKDVKYFYAAIPNQPNLKFTYNPKAAGASATIPWTATWTVPADYPAGVVNFKVLVKLNTKRVGQFVQMPVATAQLNISKTAATPYSPGAPAPDPKSTDVSLYVDSVNGTHPLSAATRPIGCSQTNVFKRGEQFVLRAWGTDLGTGDVLSSDNVKEAHLSIAGQPDVALSWGAHGATGAKVFFWSAPWNIPVDFPLGDTTVHVTYTLESGKTGSYDLPINIIP